MGFDFDRALRRATFMAMMDEENRKKSADSLEVPEDSERFWIELEGLDYDELKAMSKKKRKKILEKHGIDPDGFSFLE